jgi:GABA permease
MRSPFFSESETYQFVFVTVAAFTAIAVASILGGAWAGVPVWAVLTASAVLFYARRSRARRGIRTAPAHVGAEDEHRILVLALETVGSDDIAGVIGRAPAGAPVKVLVVCPASVSSVRHWASDIDGARARAQQTLDESIVQLREAGVQARGEVGDEDPLRAIEDALRTFGGDEIVIWTGANGSDRAAVEGARERFALPITHLQSRTQRP